MEFTKEDRVTYFPYAPPIVSTACGRSVPSGSAIAFSVPSVPALNAIGDALPGWQYNWSISPATNVAPATATNSTTFNPTFTAAAAGTTYTVTLTVADPCGVADATSTCTFNVTTPSCDMIYVSATSGNDAWAGTATAPYATIQNAFLEWKLENKVEYHTLYKMWIYKQMRYTTTELYKIFKKESNGK